MQVTLSLMANDNVSQDPVNIPHHTDRLYLDFQVDGCFCPQDPGDFDPNLPKGFCAKGSHSGPYNPRHPNHDTKYTWTATEDVNCDCPKDGHHIMMHTIHTGS